MNQPSEPASPRRLTVACPACGGRLQVSDRDFGKPRRCPSCQAVFKVGGRPPTQSERDEQAKSEFGIKCKTCRTFFYAAAGDEGKSVKCPDCHTEQVAIRTQSSQSSLGVATVVPPVDDDDLYRLAPADEPPSQPGQQPNYFSFPCTVCATPLTARPELVGKSLECPDCGTANEVLPRHVPAPKVNRIVAKDPKIGITAPVDRPAEEDNSEELMKRAHAHLEEQQSKDLRERPERPFSDGVFSYPFRMQIVPSWLVLGVLTGGIAFMIGVALSLEGLAGIAGIFLMIILAVATVVTAIVGGFVLMTILTSTAYGLPYPEWPNFEIWEWFQTALFPVAAASVTMFPVMLLGKMIPSPLARMLLSAALFYPLFPFVLISMVDGGSPASPYSRYVGQSFQLLRNIWLKFYLASGLVVVIVLSLSIGALITEHPLAMLVAGVLTGLGAVIYFRLLGRLAWVLDDRLISVEGHAQLDPRWSHGVAGRDLHDVGG